MRNQRITRIIKRDGTIVRHDPRRIELAILKASKAVGRPDKLLARRMARQVEAALVSTYGAEHPPTVEDVQDVVERIFMRWADNRLLRRMIRDRDNRNQGPIDTLTHWHYVRRSELRHIIPFQHNADYIVNSALPYELPLLKKRLFKYIVQTRRQFQDDPKRLDAHIRANRVYDLLKPLRTVRDESCVPPDALIREFIGGSCYKHH
ncbi:MAG: ATP cone domain-containing protein [Verrucomicrobia bacterium]|nr:ATP cone domain-containing protein [Verrucomicrobiota bacterium]